jgi:hypothetical protein
MPFRDSPLHSDSRRSSKAANGRRTRDVKPETQSQPPPRAKGYESRLRSGDRFRVKAERWEPKEGTVGKCRFGRKATLWIFFPEPWTRGARWLDNRPPWQILISSSRSR